MSRLFESIFNGGSEDAHGRILHKSDRYYDIHEANQRKCT